MLDFALVDVGRNGFESKAGIDEQGLPCTALRGQDQRLISTPDTHCQEIIGQEVIGQVIIRNLIIRKVVAAGAAAGRQTISGSRQRSPRSTAA